MSEANPQQGIEPVTDKFSDRALGLVVLVHRESKKMSTNKLAQLTGIQPSSMSRSERGLREFGARELARICQVFGVTEQALYDAAATLEANGTVARLRSAQQRAAEAQREINLRLAKLGGAKLG